MCDGKFGLVRHYCWRTALCSKRCADLFKTRQDGDRRWLPRLQAASPPDSPHATGTMFCFALERAR